MKAIQKGTTPKKDIKADIEHTLRNKTSKNRTRTEIQCRKDIGRCPPTKQGERLFQLANLRLMV
jgi:hypothetical protein